MDTKRHHYNTIDIKLRVVYLGTALLCLLLPLSGTEPVNVALNKWLTAEVTCGSEGAEDFFGLDMEFVLPQDRVTQTCEDNSTYPAEAMVDGNSSTWWQSMSRNRLLMRGYGDNDVTPDAVITIDLEQSFEVERIILQMGNAKRPQRIRLSKSENGVDYTRWAYRLTEEADCIFVFDTPVLSSAVNMNSVICTEFATPPLQNYERLLFDFSVVPMNLVTWRNTRYLKVEFFQMETTLGPTAFKFHHYAVRSIEVLAECVCNGHDTDCQQVNNTGAFQCICGGNTEGQFCQQCQPFYNQQPYAYGQDCVACNCHEHSDVCEYDPVLAEFSQSLDANGEYVGGGRCVDCLHNTTGVNCEQCMAYYFRAQDVVQTALDACEACACNTSGATVSPVTGLLGDCVMNDDSALPEGMVPGDCFCKTNVEGSKCDVCKAGFFSLAEDNADGCQACLCHDGGTVGGANAICEGDAGGQCPCKEFVINRQCNECMDGYYNLDAINEQGCAACDCDPGGSVHGVCNKTTGQCVCRESIAGRRCDGTDAGFYFPDLHFVYGELEHISEWATWDREQPGYTGFGYALANVNQSASAEMVLPSDTLLSGDVYILVRHRSPQLTSATILVTQISGEEQSSAVTLQECASEWCYARSDVNITLDMGQTVSVEVTVSDDTLLDRVVALPVEFEDTSDLLGEEDAANFHAICDVINDDISGPDCMQQIQSIAAFYLDGAQACACSVTGSESPDVCVEYGGQCTCKPGVTARACDTCQLEFYGLTSLGCQACNCSTDNKICDFGTGQCVCPEGTWGRACDTCVANHWNWDATTGCESCECSDLGSLSLQCDQADGTCQCKPGVGGAKCDTCLEGFTHLSVLGCEDCNCNEEGSTGHICNSTTGQCPCKDNVEGTSCNTCTAGSFYLDESHDLGCLSCVCMGVTSDCGATTWRTRTVNTALFRGGGGESGDSRTTDFALYSATRAALNLGVSITEVNGFAGLEVTLDAGDEAYWSAPDLLSGNLIGLYGNTISFQVLYVPVMSTGLPLTDAKLLIRGRDDATYQLPVSAVEPETLTLVDVKVTDADATRLDGQEVTRGDFLFALSDVSYVMIAASLYTLAHESRIQLLQYHVAVEDGLGPIARSVEQCACGDGYTGLSCEECAPGYMRLNASTHEYLGLCVACECHGHSDTCDPDTGVCLDCLHNTAGDNCELCADGYYGDASQGLPTDCTQCPCLMPRVSTTSCDVINDTVTCSCATGYAGLVCDECDEFYYGDPEVPLMGSCQACDCYGNSLLCDALTGVCTDCGFNTTGDQCERCLDGWFGDASLQNCQACDCDALGSVQALCNYTSGQCECLPGVGNRVCDGCLPDFYGYDNPAFEGCSDCECNAEGSESLQCDEAGVCTCRGNTGGDKCDLCAQGYFGLPFHACEECACDAVGSVDFSQPCEVVSGQCECKPGVGGRDCGQCDTFYFNFQADGCTTCGTCQFSLGNDTVALHDVWQLYWNDSAVVYAIEQEDYHLQTLANDINSVSSELGVSEDRLDLLMDTVAEISEDEPQHTAAVNNLIASAQGLLQASEEAKNTSSEENERLEAFLQCANNALANVNELETSSIETISQMRLNNQSAHQLLELSRTMDVGAMNVSFANEHAQVMAEMTSAQQTAENARNMTDLVHSQSNHTDALEEAGYTAQAAFMSLATPLEDAQDHVTSVQQIIDDVLAGVETTVQNRAYAESLINESSNALAISEAIQTQSQMEVDSARNLLEDAHDIREGTDDGSPLSIEEDIDFEAFPSWVQSIDNIVAHKLPPLDDGINNFNQTILSTEAHAASLNTNAQLVHAELVYVQPYGQSAVDAIHKFEEVVQVLEDSIALSQEANQTMQQAMQVFDSVSIQSLKEESAASVIYSDQNLTLAHSLDDIRTTLLGEIGDVNATLEDTILFWDDLWVDIQSFNADVTDIHASATNESREDAVVLLAVQQSSVSQGIAQLTTDSEIHTDMTAQRQEDLNVLQGKVTNATDMLATIPVNVEAFETRLNNEVQASIDVSRAMDNTSSGIQARIDAKIAQLEAAILQAQHTLEALEQPVSLDTNTYLEIENPQAEQTMLYNEIEVEFQLNLALQGVLFFSETVGTNEYLLLQVRDGKLVFGFSNVDQEVLVESPAQLCPGCWFRVLATRYGTDVKVTVTKLSTRGSVSSHGSLQSSTNDALQLDTALYVGGLPQDNYFRELGKVDFSQQGFDGCIYNMVFDGVPIPLWQTILNHASDAQCCGKPVVETPPIPTIDAVTFEGFGYIQLNYTELEVHTRSHISIQFRTFSEDAVLFLADQEDTTGYYGIYLVNGRIHLEGDNGAGRSVVLGTEAMYNDGRWYQVSAQMNSSGNALVHTEWMDGETFSTMEVRSVEHTVNLAALQFPHYTIGGQNPSTTNWRGSVRRSFAGCIQSVRTSVGSEDMTLVPLHMPDHVLGSYTVDLQQCYADVVPGIGLLDPSGYARLTSGISTITTIQFQLATYEMNGILLYVRLVSGTPNVAAYLYVALYHGDVFVVFNQGNGRQEPLRTRDVNLADGQLHNIKLDFSFHNSPRLTVDGERHYGALEMSAGMTIDTNPIYLGGVPPSIVLDETVEPVHQSLVGGIKDLAINGLTVDYFERIHEDDEQYVYFSGIPAPLDEAPPLPYPTTEAPPTTPQPVCGASHLFTLAQSGVRFGDEELSYIAYDAAGIAGLSAMLVNAFAIRIEFRALQPDGILFYMASANSNPAEYFVLYMKGGYLCASMETGTEQAFTKQVCSRMSNYNDGRWWIVEAVRLNDFMAVIVDANIDYHNNGGNSTVNTALEINTLLHVGGVAADTGAAPFNTEDVEFLGRASFHGCIRQVEIVSHDFNYVTLPLGSPDESEGVSQCFDEVSPGVYLNSTNSYVRVERDGAETFIIQAGFRVDITFRGSSVNGTLLVAHQSQGVFFLVDIIDGQICIVMGNRGQPNAPLIVKSPSLDAGYALCSDDEHTLSILLNANSLLFDFNQRGWEEWEYPGNYPAPAMYEMRLYAGGIREPSWDFPVPHSGVSFRGCVISLEVNESEFNLAASTDKRVVFAGCPTPQDPLTPWAKKK